WLILENRNDLQLHEVTPHQREFCQSLRIVRFEKVVAAAEISARPSAQEGHALRRKAASALKPRDPFRASLRIRFPGKRQHELHHGHLSMFFRVTDRSRRTAAVAVAGCDQYVR